MDYGFIAPDGKVHNRQGYGEPDGEESIGAHETLQHELGYHPSWEGQKKMLKHGFIRYVSDDDRGATDITYHKEHPTAAHQALRFVERMAKAGHRHFTVDVVGHRGIVDHVFEKRPHEAADLIRRHMKDRIESFLQMNTKISDIKEFVDGLVEGYYGWDEPSDPYSAADDREDDERPDPEGFSKMQSSLKKHGFNRTSSSEPTHSGYVHTNFEKGPHKIHVRTDLRGGASWFHSSGGKDINHGYDHESLSSHLNKLRGR